MTVVAVVVNNSVWRAENVCASHLSVPVLQWLWPKLLRVDRGLVSERHAGIPRGAKNDSTSMIGGLFVYNHKGEVLISRIYRDDVR
ncbi:unnamed protein product [Gongylonema pulchrum]|uniref:Reverse transcriptase n=1 Tax=Gongylonema pulchrum TaxID=637853 RepID=A0A183EWP7_9BILA|nr:unnamed protein product [Gongylonema pulchrum]